VPQASRKYRLNFEATADIIIASLIGQFCQDVEGDRHLGFVKCVDIVVELPGFAS
jgi:hypothetical protein